MLMTSAATRPLSVDGAEAHRVPGDPVERVRRAVEWVDDHDDVAFGLVQTALLRQHADAGPEQHAERGLVGGDVAVVLTWMRTAASEPPIGDIA